MRPLTARPRKRHAPLERGVILSCRCRAVRDLPRRACPFVSMFRGDAVRVWRVSTRGSPEPHSPPPPTLSTAAARRPRPPPGIGGTLLAESRRSSHCCCSPSPHSTRPAAPPPPPPHAPPRSAPSLGIFFLFFRASPAPSRSPDLVGSGFSRAPDRRSTDGIREEGRNSLRFSSGSNPRGPCNFAPAPVALGSIRVRERPSDFAHGRRPWKIAPICSVKKT